LGDPLPIPTIIHKTRKDWYFVKGHVDYIDVGNDWIMMRFANAEDRMLVFDHGPYHVNGLNFVVQSGQPSLILTLPPSIELTNGLERRV